MSGTLIKKISRKTVVGDVSPPEKATDLYTIMGIANGVKTGSSMYGEWLALTGQFEASNLETGEVFAAPVAFLPEPLNGLIAAKVRTPGEDGKGVSVKFAVMVGVKPAKNQFGLEYTVRELVDVKENDPLADLRQALPALPKPAAKK